MDWTTESQLFYYIAIFSVCIVVALFAQYRLRKIPTSVSRLSLSRRRGLAFAGLVICILSFAWCAALLLFGASDAGVVLVPTVAMFSLGWIILLANSRWMQTHKLWVVVFGIAGILVTMAWLLGSAGTLSSSNAQKFYLIFYPAIAGTAASVLLLISPVFFWFFRMTGVIDGD